MDKSAMEIVDRSRVGPLSGHVSGAKIIGNRQPWFDLREPRVIVRFPLHGSAATVTAERANGNVHSQRVANTIARHHHLIHSYLVTIVDRRRSTRGQKEHCRNPRLLGTD